MTEFRELQAAISNAVNDAIEVHFAEKEKSAIAKFKEARKNRNKPERIAPQWHETYTIQVERTTRKARIKVEGDNVYWTVEEPWTGAGRFDVRANGLEIVEHGKSLESLVQRTILLALSHAYCGVLE